MFKYSFLIQYLTIHWHEMCIWSRLKHPNIVPFDKIVVDEIEGRIVGFTSKYIPGGTLNENKTRVFKLQWLHELMRVIDELNLNLGMSHQDVAPRNIVIDEAADRLMLFDFDFAARIGQYEYSESRNDIKGVIFTMYEIITRDESRRQVRHEEQDVSAVEHMSWEKHPDTQLDHPVSAFRDALDAWCKRRREGRPQVTINTQAPNCLDWPPVPDPPLTKATMRQDGGNNCEPIKGDDDDEPTDKNQMQERFNWFREREMRIVYGWRRTELLKRGETVLNWWRPAQKWPDMDDMADDDIAKGNGESERARGSYQRPFQEDEQQKLVSGLRKCVSKCVMM